MTFSNDLSYIEARNKYTGCINVAATLPSQGGWVPSIDNEWLVKQDYDVLVIGDPQPINYGLMVNDATPLKEYRKQVMALPVFENSKAVKNNKVYMQTDAFFGTPSFIIGFTYLAKWFHPELFSSLNPSDIIDEYYKTFLKVDTNKTGKGIFVYPEK